MNREVETIREKVHTTADAALFLCFQEVKGSHSKGVIRLPLLHYDIPFEGYGEMLLRMNRIYDLLGMPDAGSCMRSLSEGEKEEWEFTDEMKNNQRINEPIIFVWTSCYDFTLYELCQSFVYGFV